MRAAASACLCIVTSTLMISAVRFAHGREPVICLRGGRQEKRLEEDKDRPSVRNQLLDLTSSAVACSTPPPPLRRSASQTSLRPAGVQFS
jgi:hypothetical protein